VLVITDIYV